MSPGQQTQACSGKTGHTSSSRKLLSICSMTSAFGVCALKMNLLSSLVKQLHPAAIRTRTTAYSAVQAQALHVLPLTEFLVSFSLPRLLSTLAVTSLSGKQRLRSALQAETIVLVQGLLCIVYLWLVDVGVMGHQAQ